MNLISFPVRYYQDEGGNWNAEFPDLEGCLTCGETLEEVKVFAVEALTGYLLASDADAYGLLKNVTADGDTVTPELPVALALTIRKMRLAARLNQGEAAERIGVSQQTYRRWENPELCNATAETIAKIAKAFGRRVEMSFPEAS